MISFFPRKKELRLRRDILRGVYEDNLRIVGKLGQTAIAKRRPFYLRKAFLVIFMALAAVMLNGKYTAPPFSFDEKPTSSPIKEPLSYEPAAAPEKVTPSDYKALVGNSHAPLSRVFGLGIKTIMIDPGHGGVDNGTTGRWGTKEKDITLDIAKRLKARLERSGKYNVLMTRDTDVTLPLNKRVEMAAAAKADLFVSVHLNYLPSKPINIIETYYFGPSSDAKVLKLAEQENAGSSYGLSDFKEIIGKIGETMKLQESRELAALIQTKLFMNIKREDGVTYDFGVKRAPFVVLLGVDVPAVLTEVSCLSNSEEEIKMNRESHRENIAHYLEAGILDYLNKGEKIYESDSRAER